MAGVEDLRRRDGARTRARAARGGVRRHRRGRLIERAFYDRDVNEVAPDLIGCIVRHGATSGRIVEVEAYHQSEPACHAYAGLTERTKPLFGPGGVAYVYFSYGMHSLLNAVTGPAGEGAAVLIRALEPIDGEGEMFARRRVARWVDLANGPGKLTQALGVGLADNATSLLGDGPITIEPRPPDAEPPTIVTGTRIGITKAADLPWRYCDADSQCVSKPWPPGMRRATARRASA